MSTHQRFLQLNALRIRRINIERMIKDAIFIALGVIAAAFGLKSFLLPSHFLDGGVMGISLLIHNQTDFDLSYLVVIINIPFIVIAYTQVSKSFAAKTLIAIALLAVLLAFVPFPFITSDKLLISFFGGFFLGLGIGLSIRGGSVIDGTEVLAIYTSRKTVLTVGDIILILNIGIFSVAAYLISIETALYAILTYLVASKTVDFVVHGIEEYISVMIVSEKSEEIKNAITKNMGRGVTVLQGKGGFGKRGHQEEDYDVIFSVITRLELQKLKTEVAKIDENAFMVENSVSDIKGGMIKKRPLQE
ncbi:MAG TPA: YitT family protein [Cyclobacteriaceae bacterium]|nr:YitT family protein [Cyclobacteriaceae bacterium]HMV10352.1 YitT family protein [Cyclobacteriaceae bacterium]HMV89494.1 YitT family protein [Cyclobacteriaceae bacterium]HMX02741.1 YitT family protein [Cyclobacteriaceae bacterium]HMY92534.1 YitT family protein [Cyclobacteriaceae bacterium]